LRVKCSVNHIVIGLLALGLAGQLACSRPSAQTATSPSVDSAAGVNWSVRGAEMKQRMADLELKQRYWIEERIPSELGQARMQDILADSAGFAAYRELDDRLAAIVNGQRQVYFEFTRLQTRLDSLSHNEAERERIVHRLGELSHQDKQLYDNYIVWESAMIAFLQRWKLPRTPAKAPRS
jgi:hypothetical protein